MTIGLVGVTISLFLGILLENSGLFGEWLTISSKDLLSFSGLCRKSLVDVPSGGNSP